MKKKKNNNSNQNLDQFILNLWFDWFFFSNINGMHVEMVLKSYQSFKWYSPVSNRWHLVNTDSQLSVALQYNSSCVCVFWKIYALQQRHQISVRYFIHLYRITYSSLRRADTYTVWRKKSNNNLFLATFVAINFILWAALFYTIVNLSVCKTNKKGNVFRWCDVRTAFLHIDCVRMRLHFNSKVCNKNLIEKTFIM